MRYIHFIFALVASIVVSACVTNDIDEYLKPVDRPTYGGDLQVVGRITQYSDCDVATRSKKEGDESKVTSMGLALFPIENGTIGNCLYYDFQLGGSIVFIVDRHDDVFKDCDDKQFAMYIFANMQDAVGFPTIGQSNRDTESDSGKIDGVGKSLDYFTKCAADASTTVKEVPANGFPMVGSLGNTLTIDGIENDGKILVLKPKQTDANVDGLPLVDGQPTDNLEIPLKSLYAKFSFTISVVPDQEIVGNKAPRFDLLSYQVNNIAATVDSDASTNDDNDVESSVEINMGNYAQGATKATFTFYLPERKLTPSITDINEVLPAALKKKEGTYGTDVDADQNGYRDKDERYHQRYKNKLVDGKAATYVTIVGKYTDHQENNYDVTYNIYLGGNNYDDFNIIRNTHYINSITIRGISASKDQSVNDDGISIDWRVNVDRSTPLVINLRRESLLDSHYEVRPLRLRLVGENITTGTSATVQIISGDLTDSGDPWIRLEASGTTDDNYITTDGSSKGKRKYFTTNLVTETLADSGKSVTVNNLTDANQTVWIYVDENTTNKSRAAIVRVSYAGVNKDFEIVQHGLYEVKSSDGKRTYYIEQYEEYLYNYDAEDSYGQIKEEGLPWGLDGVQLSNEHQSFTIDENNSSWQTYIANNPAIVTYDFYTWEQDSLVMKKAGIIDGKTDKRWHQYAGQHFTEDIFKKSNNGVKVRTMAEPAEGAVEYCYNKNKRNLDGSIAKVEWYLPSAGELEDFIVAAYSSFEEFQNNYYWTSQPAYTRNGFYYEYKEPSGFLGLGSKTVDTYAFIVYEDNKKYARATKVVSLGNDKYDYAKSGLNDNPNEKGIVNNEALKSGTPTDTLGYFKTWYRWKKPARGDAETTPLTSDQWFWEYKDEQAKERFYYAFVNENYFNPEYNFGMLQEGYHLRTKHNRIRCIRKVEKQN